jgi:hypothetical protein
MFLGTSNKKELQFNYKIGFKVSRKKDYGSKKSDFSF